MADSKTLPKRQPSAVGKILSVPPQLLEQYGDFIAKNAGQVSQIESALRSLTYIIPGRFRDAEIASESIHSGVQLLTMYHDSVLEKAVAKLPAAPIRSGHARYTRHWADKSATYRRIATVLQMVQYTELLCEMSAKRRGGEKMRWRTVVALEVVKAICRLLLMSITKSRQLLSPALPEREPIPEEEEESEESKTNEASGTSSASQSEFMATDHDNHHDHENNLSGREASDLLKAPHERDWSMPRTGMSLPSLPDAGDIGGYLVSRVLTADDIRPATKLLNRLTGGAQAAEVLHILAPVIYATLLMRAKDKKSWTPWIAGLAVEYAARQLRDVGSVRMTALERDEWQRRGWAMGWWSMRGAFYDRVTSRVVGGMANRMPGFVSGIVEDYAYLWENYYFATSA